MNRELVPPQNLYQMPRRPSSRLWRLALPAMRHLLLYRFVPSPRSYRHNRGSTAIVTDSHARRFRAEGVGRRATELGCRSRGGVVMNVTAEVPALLALDAGIKETDWAVPALDLLVSSLSECSTERGFPQFSYTRLGSTCGHRRASQRLP